MNERISVAASGIRSPFQTPKRPNVAGEDVPPQYREADDGRAGSSHSTPSFLRKWGTAAVGAMALSAAVAIGAPSVAQADTGFNIGPNGVTVWSTPNYPTYQVAPHPVFYPATTGISIDGNMHAFDQCNNVMDNTGHYRFVTDGYQIATSPPTICQWGY